MSRVEDALMRLYESADIRDELTDEEASALLKWAETELTRLDTPATDDGAFEAQVDTLMKLLKQMNRYAGRQGQGFAAQGVNETPEKIAALASALGHTADAGLVAAAGTGEPASTLAALTAMLSPVANTLADEPPDEPPVTQTDEPVDESPETPAEAPPDESPVTPLDDQPQIQQLPTDAKTETWETYFDDDSTVEARATARARNRATAVDGWLYPDADADRDPDPADADPDPADRNAD